MNAPVRIWLLSTTESVDTIDDQAATLPPTERARAAELLDPEARAEFVLCRVALRQLLSEALNVDAASLRFTQGAHGKPALADHQLEFNLSHSDGLAVIAVADRPVGVDVQQRRTGAGLDRMAERYFSPMEASWMRSAPDQDELGRRFSRLWSRKEACLKVTGGRLIPSLVWPLSTFDNGTFGWTEPAVTGRDLAVPVGYHGAVALAGAEHFDVQLTWWSPATTHPDGVPMAGSPC